MSAIALIFMLAVTQAQMQRFSSNPLNCLPFALVVRWEVMFSQGCVCSEVGGGIPHLHLTILQLVQCPFRGSPSLSHNTATGPVSLLGVPQDRVPPWPRLGGVILHPLAPPPPGYTAGTTSLTVFPDNDFLIVHF